MLATETNTVGVTHYLNSRDCSRCGSFMQDIMHWPNNDRSNINIHLKKLSVEVLQASAGTSLKNIVKPAQHLRYF